MGNGQYGSTHPVVITCGFRPKVFWVSIEYAPAEIYYPNQYFSFSGLCTFPTGSSTMGSNGSFLFIDSMSITEFLAFRGQSSSELYYFNIKSIDTGISIYCNAPSNSDTATAAGIQFNSKNAKFYYYAIG